jgi:hypothetical protein
MSREAMTIPISINRSRNNRAAFVFSIGRTPDYVQAVEIFATYASRG